MLLDFSKQFYDELTISIYILEYGKILIWSEEKISVHYINLGPLDIGREQALFATGNSSTII